MVKRQTAEAKIVVLLNSSSNNKMYASVKIS